MLEKVFANLLDNSVRHGEHVNEIRVSYRMDGTALVVVWEDNGTGIVASDKEKIFGRGYGKNTGMGLFLIREILALTGISIRETGVPGSGARFEILVPEGKYRLAVKDIKNSSRGGDRSNSRAVKRKRAGATGFLQLPARHEPVCPFGNGHFKACSRSLPSRSR